MEKVVICIAESYENIEDVLHRALEPLGGITRFVTAGQRVLIKPNMLAAKPPEAAVTTHPKLLSAVVSMVRAAGAEALVGDSPGIGSMARVGEKSGIRKAVEAAGGCMIAFDETCLVDTGGRFRQLELASAYMEADVVINLPKLKTHEMMTLTCAVKNLYGAVVGPAKAGLHLTAGHSRELFAGLLLEIAHARPVALTIVDGVLAMEGNGPNSGSPRDLGILMAGENLVAIDTVAAAVAGIPPLLLPVEQEARLRGMPGTELEQIEICGDLKKIPEVGPFKLPEGLDVQFGLPGFLKKILRNQLTPLPVADPTQCVLCGICRDACPPKAITINKNALRVDSGRCIRCWCCRELCPHHALKIEKSMLLKLLSR